jgi:hypothetical protein
VIWPHLSSDENRASRAGSGDQTHPRPGRLKTARTGGSGVDDRADRREEPRPDRAVVADRLDQDRWLVEVVLG